MPIGTKLLERVSIQATDLPENWMVLLGWRKGARGFYINHDQVGWGVSEDSPPMFRLSEEAQGEAEEEKRKRGRLIRFFAKNIHHRDHRGNEFRMNFATLVRLRKKIGISYDPPQDPLTSLPRRSEFPFFQDTLDPHFHGGTDLICRSCERAFYSLGIYYFPIWILCDLCGLRGENFFWPCSYPAFFFPNLVSKMGAIRLSTGA